MMNNIVNKRKHNRIPATITILIKHKNIGEKLVKTKDISDGGLFLLVDPDGIPDVGQVVIGQVQDLPDAPVVEMEIVRIELDGIGLRYINICDFT